MRFQLEGSNLAEIHERAITEYGQHARIVSAEKVTTGGIGGFLGKAHFEAIIEVPEGHEPDGRLIEPQTGQPADPAPSDVPVMGASDGNGSHGASRRDTGTGSGGGINELLQRAEAAELRLGTTPPVPAVRGPVPALGGRPDFSRVLDGQAFALQPATGIRAARASSPAAGRTPVSPRGSNRVPGIIPEARSVPAARSQKPSRASDMVPSALTGAGDLVVVIGLWGDAGMAAEELHDGTALRRNAGDLAQKFDALSLARKPVTDRRGILRARAAAVAEAVPLVISMAINPQQALLPQLGLLEILEADQLWVAVDAGRKVEDTAAWVKHVAAGHGLYAVVSLHGDETLSPESVWELGFPVLEARGPIR